MINLKLCRDSQCLVEGAQSLEAFPRSSYYADWGARDGRHIYCKACCRRRSAGHRTMLMREGRKGFKSMRISRKAYRISHPKGRPPTDMVMEAIRRGAHSRSEIKRVTKLSWDSTVDSIATLRFEQNLLQSRVVNGERMFFLRAA